jgi:hypothetical protein
MEFETLTTADARYPKKLLDRMRSTAPTLYMNGPLKLLDRFTMAVIAADLIPGHAMLATNDMLFKIREYALNYIGPWHSVWETEIFRLALDTPTDRERRRSLTICTARGLARETWDNFLGDRFGYEGPFTGFPQKEEFYRRARAGELLWLSITPPEQKRYLRQNILLRNWMACALADVVFIPFSEKGAKSFDTVKKVVDAKIPAFTCDHEVCKDLFALGIPPFTRKTVGKHLESLGASTNAPPPFLPPSNPEIQTGEPNSAPANKLTQMNLIGCARNPTSSRQTRHQKIRT